MDFKFGDEEFYKLEFPVDKKFSVGFWIYPLFIPPSWVTLVRITDDINQDASNSRYFNFI